MVFLSHSSVDKPFVKFVECELNACRHQTWLDEKELAPGDELQCALSGAIHRSQSLLLFLSRASLASKWVRYEYEAGQKLAAESAALSLIPCVLGQVTDIELSNAGFGNLVFVDFRSASQYERQMNRLLKALAAADSESRLSSFDGERSDRLALCCRIEPLRSWALEFLRVTMAGREDDTERYWAYITIAAIGDSSWMAYLEQAICDERPFARRGAQDALEALQARGATISSAGENQ